MYRCSWVERHALTVDRMQHAKRWFESQFLVFVYNLSTDLQYFWVEGVKRTRELRVNFCCGYACDVTSIFHLNVPPSYIDHIFRFHPPPKNVHCYILFPEFSTIATTIFNYDISQNFLLLHWFGLESFLIENWKPFIIRQFEGNGIDWFRLLRERIFHFPPTEIYLWICLQRCSTTTPNLIDTIWRWGENMVGNLLI